VQLTRQKRVNGRPRNSTFAKYEPWASGPLELPQRTCVLFRVLRLRLGYTERFNPLPSPPTLPNLTRSEHLIRERWAKIKVLNTHRTRRNAYTGWRDNCKRRMSTLCTGVTSRYSYLEDKVRDIRCLLLRMIRPRKII